MRNFLRKLRPNSINDIVAAIALFRPGAAVNIDSYIRRKHGEEKVIYLDKSLEEITKDTYGLLIYQEQIMQVASKFAGYTLGEADILRRAMSKKKVDLLKAEEEKFINKSIEMGHSESKAREIFNLVLNFAGYGFNKSHSVVYSVVAYKMAYLKSHYKTVFFANLMSNVIGSETKTNEYIMEAKANKIEIEKQIVDREEREKIKKLKELEEGKKIKKEQDKYLMSLEEIRKQKIKELKDLNIKDEYILPLEKYNYNNIENQNK
jgi:DNA polymerase-3 subunit alpha